MKFYSAYNPASSLSETKCPKELQNYKYDEVKHSLVKADKIPFYKEIQSHYESTKLSTKLTRYTMGDITALGFESDNYFNASGQSTNLAQVLNTNQVAKAEFDKLPADVKRLFNNNFTEFIRSVEDGTFETRLVEFAKSRGTSGSGTTSEPGTSNNGAN